MKYMAVLRKKKGMTQVELAEKVGVAANTIPRYERGELTPSLKIAHAIAEVLGCTEAELLHGPNDSLRDFKLILDKEGECSLDMVNMSATAPEQKVMVVSGDRIAIQINLKTTGMDKEAAQKAMFETLSETLDDALAQQEKWRNRKTQG